MSDVADGVHFDWGTFHGAVTDADIEHLLAFFPPAAWKRLGASRTSPPPDGFGVYLRTTLPRFTSGHASAVAAILVSEGWLDFKQDGNAICLRRVDKD